MPSPPERFVPVSLSLADLLGREYALSVCRARSALTGQAVDELCEIAERRVDFFDEAFERRLITLLPKTGTQVAPGLATTPRGASPASFDAATHTSRAPLSGLGWYRLGESGNLYLTSKCEHYHVPLGHAFPGYRLIDLARQLGIPNATHNNTRGYVTRKLEEELVRTANGLAPGDAAGLARVRDADSAYAVNRVLNLETGSLAVEAALKLVLARFHAPESSSRPPVHASRIPVILAVGDNDGGYQANYHGTTLLTQTLRGMWRGIRETCEAAGLYRVVPVRPNRIEDVRAAFETFDRGETKVAAFFHEIVMMNYGAVLLRKDYLQEAYALCREHDCATIDDEIQSCLWHHDLYMFREWGLTPTCVAVGKGFPGGEYAASRLLFSSAWDTLSQFGALVTNGQEELASLAYLVTMAWAEANADVTRAVGDYFEERLRDLAARHEGIVTAVEGRRHLVALHFHTVDDATRFASALSGMGCDVSVHTYKIACPPAALIKIPLIMGRVACDFLLEKMGAALSHVGDAVAPPA